MTIATPSSQVCVCGLSFSYGFVELQNRRLLGLASGFLTITRT